MERQLHELKRELEEIRCENRALCGQLVMVLPLGRSNDLVEEVKLILRKNEYEKLENIMEGVQQQNTRVEA